MISPRESLIRMLTVARCFEILCMMRIAQLLISQQLDDIVQLLAHLYQQMSYLIVGFDLLLRVSGVSMVFVCHNWLVVKAGL